MSTTLLYLAMMQQQLGVEANYVDYALVNHVTLAYEDEVEGKYVIKYRQHVYTSFWTIIHPPWSTLPIIRHVGWVTGESPQANFCHTNRGDILSGETLLLYTDYDYEADNRILSLHFCSGNQVELRKR
jgi:hypothetical protein